MKNRILSGAKRDSKGKVKWPNKALRAKWRLEAASKGLRVVTSPAIYSHEGQGKAPARRLRQMAKIAARKAA